MEHSERLTIAVLAGTTRVQRKSIQAARVVADYGRTLENVDIIFVDPNDFHFPGDGNDPEGKDPRYTEIVTKADGFIIVSPEYNHSFPGSLKRMIDSELNLYTHKPVAFAGVSDGPWGGVRMIEALLSPVRTMGLVASFRDLQFPKVDELFDEHGNLNDKEAYDRRLADFYTEFLWLVRTLKWGRANVPSKYHEQS